jgi:L-alanine-DL-glutamate epimerase-like enolase superfamily enzyme
MNYWNITDLPLKLKYQWKIARNATNFKHNLMVEFLHEGIESIGEVAPNVRYGENTELLKQQFLSAQPILNNIINEHPATFAERIKSLPIANSLKNGIETAYVHHYCIKNNVSIYELLNIKSPGEKVCSTYTLPIMPAHEIADFIEKNNLTRFHSLKVKVNQEHATEIFNAVEKCYSGPLYIDGNETWNSSKEVLNFLETINLNQVKFIEQPIPDQLIHEYVSLKKHIPIAIILDESVKDNPNFNELVDQCHGINMKMMKAGGYYNSLNILTKAKENQLETMIGCMIETTLGIFSAFHLCNEINYLDLDGFFVVDEEPFSLGSENQGELSINKNLFYKNGQNSKKSKGKSESSS